MESRFTFEVWDGTRVRMPTTGRYSLIKKIADGGMAEIFLARLEGAQGFKKPVVLKRIRTAFYADPQFRNMLLDEAHIAMSLNHSNIVQVLDLGESAGRYFLALELVDGWSAEALVRRAEMAGLPLPRELSLYIVLQVCRALAYAHSMRRDGEPLGIVHRDISPQNILISEQGEVKLADFGIAKALGRREKTAAGIVKGKVYFMSPEQAEATELDHRSDLFSLGTVLYYFVTNRLAFQAPTALEALLRIKAADFPSPASVVPSLEPEVNRIILKAMQLKVGDRYGSADEMLTDVEKVLRTTFPPAGQTELKRWLEALQKKDHEPPISQAEGPPPEEDEEPLDEWVELSDSSIIPPTLPPRKNKPPELPAHARGPSRATRSVRAWPALLLGMAILGVGIWVLRPGAQRPMPQLKLPDTWPSFPQLRAGAGALDGGPLGTSDGLGADDGRHPLGMGPVVDMPMLTPVPGMGVDGGRFASAGQTVAPDAGAAMTGASSGTLATPLATGGNGALDGGLEAKLNEPADDETEQKLLREAIPDPDKAVIGEEAAAAAPPSPPAAAKLESTAPRPVVAERTPRQPQTTANTSRSGQSSSTLTNKAETVSVLIQSVPAGAIVKLGSRVFGRTPINLRFKPDILFELTFVKSGYVTTSRRFFVYDRSGQKVTTFLRRASQKKR